MALTEREQDKVLRRAQNQEIYQQRFNEAGALLRQSRSSNNQREDE